MNKIPKITKGNDFKLSLHMTETMCNGGIADLEGTITSVNLVSSNGSKITVQEGNEVNGKIMYHDVGDSTIIIAVLNPLPLGKYGVEVNGKRNSDNSDFRYFNDYVFEVVKTTADGFIPCNSTMTYSIVGANVGLATSIGGSSMEQVQADWEQTDSTKVDYIKNKPNVYEKPNGGIPKTDLASDVQTSLSKANTAIQSLNGYATESWVTNQGYLTQHQSLNGYATEQWVNNQGYLKTHQSLNGYATESWVGNQGYLTQHQAVDQELTSGSTNAVSSKAVYDALDDNEYVIAQALTDLNTRLTKLSEDVARLLANTNT